MGRKVPQPDGTNCYTENCRIHNRNNFIGAEAAIYDAETTVRVQKVNSVTNILLERLGSVLYDPAKAAEHVVNRLEKTMNTDDLPKYIKEAIDKGKNKLPTQKWDEEKVWTASSLIRTELFNKSVILNGDQVIIKETGERGEVMEGNTFMGGLARVSTETRGKNDFGWFKSDDLVKVVPATDDSPARQQILSAKKDSLLGKETLAAYIEEESNPAAANPQALHGLGSEKQKTAVQQELSEASERVRKGFSDTGMTKDRMVRFLNDEFHKRRSWLDEVDRTNVKNAFFNLVNYLRPS